MVSMKIVPEKEWIFFSQAMVLHGRYICVARKPRCFECQMVKICPFSDKVFEPPNGEEPQVVEPPPPPDLDDPRFYLNRELSSLEFFRRVPTVWDETRVIHGEIGRFATIARRHGDEWFVGTINSREPRTLSLPLEFLSPDRSYRAHVYTDDEAATTATKVGVSTRTVDSRTILDVPLKPGGGQAVWIAPAP